MQSTPLTPMICAYPECSNMFWITVQQKREFKVQNVLKYGDSSDPCCSIECQRKLLKELEECEFLDKRNIKNRDYALVVHGAEEDITKRPKEMKLHLITGNKTKQRAGCLGNKLMSMTPRKLKISPKPIKFLYPLEVQDFLSTLPDDLQVSDDRIQVTASELITILPEMFPNEISIEWIDGKTRVLVYIK